MVGRVYRGHIYTFEDNHLTGLHHVSLQCCSTFLDMKRRLREPRLGWRGERLRAVAVASALPRRVDGATVPAGQRHAFVAEAVGEGGGGVVDHAKKVVGELV